LIRIDKKERETKRQKKVYFPGLKFGNRFWTFINVHFMKRPTALCKKQEKKALVTEMLSFSEILEKCCYHHFFCFFYGKFRRIIIFPYIRK